MALTNNKKNMKCKPEGTNEFWTTPFCTPRIIYGVEDFPLSDIEDFEFEVSGKAQRMKKLQKIYR